MLRDRGAPTVGASLAAAWLLTTVAVDFAVRAGGISIAPLFALSPLIACAVLPARRTAVFSVLAVLATVVSGGWSGTWGTTQQTVRLVDVVLVSGVAVVVAWVRVSREQQHERVVAIAEVAQRAILPLLPSRVERMAVATRYLSAAEDAVVGGDLYDCYHSESYTRFLVGDVRGKGVAAVEHAARVIRAFRQAAALRPTLTEVAEEMSAYLSAFFDDEDFATALLVDASDPDRLVVVSCGHPEPLFVGPDGTADYLETEPCLPLGLGAGYEAVSVDWSAGQRLLMYTDGLSEARDGDGEFLPLVSLVQVLSNGDGEEALDRLLEAVREHVPGGLLNDDLAVLLVEHLADDAEIASWPLVRTRGLQLADR
jgi:hypothetical protein